ncbi:hypothetical protein [Frankia sp. CiP1_Cm_nod2]|uniref:hypothetical protein n=1 Tax=Frankia sp. CiP1_Cm_nod2 TaxID=2897161 RepID=UPI0020256141
MTSAHRSRTGRASTHPSAPGRRSSHRQRHDSDSDGNAGLTAGHDIDHDVDPAVDHKAGEGVPDASAVSGVATPELATSELATSELAISGTPGVSSAPDASEAAAVPEASPHGKSPGGEDQDGPALETATGGPGAPGGGGRRRLPAPAVPTLARVQVLVALVAGLAAAVTAAVALGVHADRAGRHPVSTNDAFVDSAATTALLQDIGKVVETVFTVNPGNVATTEQAAKDSLTGRATDQYEQLYRPLLQQAPTRGVTVTTTVRAIGVTALNGSRADVLVLADQAAKSASAQQSNSSGPAHLGLILENQAGHWKISSIEIL